MRENERRSVWDSWRPYHPTEYEPPDGSDPKFHNPWVPVDPISGKTAYALWRDKQGT